MNSIQFLAIAFIFGCILSSSKGNLLLNICFDFRCDNDDSYLKFVPANFNSDVYNHTILIPSNYPSYTPTGPLRVEFYVIMNVSNTNEFNDKKQSVAKSILYNGIGEKILAMSDLAFSSNEMLLISGELPFDNENQVVTQLIVYEFDDNIIRKSDPYILTFKR